MSLAITCKHCGFPVQFEEEDRGFEVYCNSCGRANLIPVEPELDQPPQEPAEPAEPTAEAAEPESLYSQADESGDQSPEPAEPIAETTGLDRPYAEPDEFGYQGAEPAEPIAQTTEPYQPPEESWEAAESVAGTTEPEQPPEESWQAAEAVEEYDEPPGDREPEDAARASVSVFSAAGTIEVEQRVVGEEICLCGTRIPVRVEDYGNSIYCPSCAAEIQVGSTLDQPKYRVAREVEEEHAESKSIPVRKPRMRLIRSPLGVAAMLLVMASAALGGYFTWQHPKQVMNAVRLVLPSREPPVKPLPDDYVPPDSQQAQRQQPQPVDDVPPPPVTMEMIEGLLGHPDLAEALVQAQIWQESLRDQGVTEDDLRLVKLAEVIDMLTARLAPKPQGPPPHLAEFRRLVEAIAEGLNAGDLKAARKALDQAEGYLREHQDELAPYCQRFLRLKAQVQSREAQTGGADRIRESLAQAEQALAAGNVTAALEAEAEAKFMALSTPLTEQEYQELDQKARQLMPKMRFGRGKRAVADARRCQEQRDVEARNREVRRAFSLLPGLPESQVNPLLDQVRPWEEEADKARKQFRAKSSIAREIELRDRYEAMLEHYGNGDSSKLVQACVELEKLLPDDEQSRQRRQQIEQSLFDVLERDVNARLQELDPATGEAEFLRQVSEIRRVLDQASPWQTSHRWKALEAVIRQHGSRLAQTYLDEAVALAEQDKLSQAIERIAQAEQFGTPELTQRARTLSQKWQSELKLRADRKAEEESWQRIEGLRDRPKRRLELWQQLQLFRRRFTEGSHAQEADELANQTRQTIEKIVPEAIRHAKGLFEREEWANAREYVKRLQSVPMPPDQRPALDQLLARLEDLQQSAASEFVLLGRHKALLTEHDVLIVLPALTEILAKDPDHEEARALRETAKQRAQVYAEKLLRSAPYFRIRKPELYADKLRRVLKLDPDGPYGQEARRLLGRS